MWGSGKLIDIEDQYEAKWNYFNEYFKDALGFLTATHYSALWYDGETWDELNEIMGQMEEQERRENK